MTTNTADLATHRLHVAERFGPTLQGEGPSTGQQALFIRLSRCNLTCPRCDTPYTWDWTQFNPREESRKIPISELYQWAMSHPPRIVVITGGEPLLQQQALLPLVQALAHQGRRIEIETNGTIPPTADLVDVVTQFNVSPKTAIFAGDTNTTGAHLNPDALRAFTRTGKSIFKYVVTCQEDLHEIARHEDEFGLTPLWVMPEGTTQETLLARMSWLADAAIRRNWHLSTRLHILLWGNQRGR